MSEKVKVGAVSYLNTKPLLFGLDRTGLSEEMTLTLDHPSNLATRLGRGQLDLALIPVAAIPSIPNAIIVSDYCIACDGEVASVCLFSQSPISEVTSVLLDYESKTSVALVKILLRRYWHREVAYLPAYPGYEDEIGSGRAGLIIGDRALRYRASFSFVYDLGTAWKAYTGLPFVFAAWVANKPLNEAFLARFNDANAIGVRSPAAVAAQHPFAHFDLLAYYTEHIHYQLNDEKRKGLHLFLKKLNEASVQRVL